MKKSFDVLIVARPDHSMQIYRTLQKQNSLSYKFLTFKVFPEWLKKVTHCKKMTSVTNNVICSWRLTLVNLCRFKFKFGFAQNWDETRVFDRILKKLFNKSDVKLIHYWPEYGDHEISQYAANNPSVKVFADIHMPHPLAVYNSMIPIYEKFGIKPENTQLYRMSKEQSCFADNSKNLLVPSSYVADTYREIYKDKNYYIVSYGATRSSTYRIRHKEKVSEFVYAGRISLEKGSDILLDLFKMHPELHLHLFGEIPSEQKVLFEPYKQYRNIVFHGSVPKILLQEHLEKYDVGIHLSRFDAYSLAVGEMIGCGLPVIVSSFTGNMDDVKKENLGIVVDLEPELIDAALLRMINVEEYNTFVDSIAFFLDNRNVPYSEKVIEFYKKELNR